MTPFRTVPRLRALGLGIALSVGAVPALAQEMDHSKMQMPPATPAPPAKKPVAKKPASKKPAAQPAPTKKKAADPHAGHTMPPPKAAPASSPPTAVDHAAMGHDMPMPVQTGQDEPMDHAAMGNETPMPQEPPQPVDHAAMGHEMPPPAQADQTEPMDHAAMGHDMPMPQEPAQPMDHSTMEGMTMAPTEPITPIPVLTDADRVAAVPPPGGHTVHDNSIQSYVLLDRLETWDADPGTGLAWKEVGWIGTDLNRLWVRSEGERERERGSNEKADIEVLYGRSIAPWWDVVAGVRQDFDPGSSQTFAAIGVQGLAPYKFEVEATAYVSPSGQTAARLEAEYDTLLTNRLILQWQAEAELYGKDDERRGIGAGLSTVEGGLRLRYEFTRQFAPYIGIVRERAFGGTADFRRAESDDIDDTRVVAGVRIWF